MRGVSRRVEIEELAHLRAACRRRCLQAARRKQIALVALAAGVADHAGGAADDRDRLVAGVLEAAQHQQRQQVADVQAVGRGIEAGVDGARLFVEPAPTDAGVVGRLVDQATPARDRREACSIAISDSVELTATGRRRRRDAESLRAWASAAPLAPARPASVVAGGDFEFSGEQGTIVTGGRVVRRVGRRRWRRPPRLA